MRIEEAYTKILACKMWALFGPYALRHGYSVINDYDCSGYGKKDAIEDVLIGSEVGQFDTAASRHLPSLMMLLKGSSLYLTRVHYCILDPSTLILKSYYFFIIRASMICLTFLLEESYLILVVIQ